MDIEILKLNQENLNSLKNAISNFANPHILDNHMENLKVLNNNLSESKQQKKLTRAWLKENKELELYSEYNSFFKRYEKCFTRIQEFQKKFSSNTIGLKLNECIDLLSQNFEAKANLSAQTFSLAQSNFNLDIHSKTILVEAKYQKGSINADTAFEHMSKLENAVNKNPLSNGDTQLKDLISSYKEDYSKKALFKNHNESYSPENLLSNEAIEICKADIQNNRELQDLMKEATSMIIDLSKKLDLAKINNSLIKAQEFISTFGSDKWDEKKATKFMDKFENDAQDLEKLAYEFDIYQTKLAELIFKIQQKNEQSKHASEQIARIEAENKLNTLIENINEINKLVKNNTPFVFIKNHFTILNNDFKAVENVLGNDAIDSVMQKLGDTRTKLLDLDLVIRQAELMSKKEQTEGSVLEYKPDEDYYDKPRR